MTWLVERLVELRRHIDHLRVLQGRVQDPHDLDRDLTLHNDVLFSLFTVCQMVIDISGELAARRGDRFEDYTEAVRTLVRDGRFPLPLVARLEVLPGFRNVLVHEYVGLDMRRVVEALNDLEPLEQFAEIARQILLQEQGG